MQSLSAHADTLPPCRDERPGRRHLRLVLDALSLWRRRAAGFGSAASFHALLGAAGTLLLGIVWGHSPSAWMALLAGSIALIGAAGAFSHLRLGLNACEGSGAKPLAALTVDPFMRTRMLGFAALCAGVLATLGLLVASTMLHELSLRAGAHAVLAKTVLVLVLWSLGCALLGMLLAAMLRTMPDAPASRPAVGSASAAGAMVIGTATMVMGLHLPHAIAGPPEILGEAAIACVLWVCLCVQSVLLAGALANAIDRSNLQQAAKITVHEAVVAAPMPTPSAPSQEAPASITRARSLHGPQPQARRLHAQPCVVLQFSGRRRSPH